MTEYNGHRSWNAWNVSLWICNEEPLYRLACECVDTSRTLQIAAKRFLAVTGLLNERTPDGAVYNITCVREALAGLRE